MSPDKLLRDLFDAAVAAAHPSRCVPGLLPSLPCGRTVVLGGGKAAAAMARAVESHWSGPLEGLVIVPYGHTVECDQIEVVQAAHPIPDKAGLKATERLLALAKGLGPEDLALCLISGGGSSLMTYPAQGVTLEEKRRATDKLLRSGASIREINRIRTKMSAIKGGGLARACHPAAVVTLAISDVVGDDPSMIASGPSYLPPTALLPTGLLPTHGPETNRQRELNQYTIIARSSDAIRAATELASERGVRSVDLGALEGSATEIAETLIQAIETTQAESAAGEAPTLLLSGGEATVQVRGSGRGGPNTELLLELGRRLETFRGIWALSADTDGIDGTGPHAGAILTPTTLERAAERGLDLDKALQNNDSLGFFSELGDELVTGPTLTNVNDFRAVLVG